MTKFKLSTPLDHWVSQDPKALIERAHDVRFTKPEGTIMLQAEDFTAFLKWDNRKQRTPSPRWSVRFDQGKAPSEAALARAERCKFQNYKLDGTHQWASRKAMERYCAEVGE